MASVNCQMSVHVKLDGKIFLAMMFSLNSLLLWHDLSFFSCREGVDCGTCIKMPGCQRGSCAEEGGQAQPLTCKCEDTWKGALCDQRK